MNNNKYNYGYIGVINEKPIEWDYFPDLQTTLPYNCSRIYGLSESGADALYEIYTSYTDAGVLSFIVNNEEDYCKEVKFKQFTSIDRWDDNAECFDELANRIKTNKTDELINVINEMLTWAESNLDTCNYSDVVNGKANNSGEVVVYENNTYILTASETTITLFVIV